MKTILEECVAARNGHPFLTAFAPAATPLELLCAYTMFCRGKESAAFLAMKHLGLDKQVLLDISSLHLTLRQLYFWGDRRFQSNDYDENAIVPALIPARGNSKGIPKKNLAKLNGTSLLKHAVTKLQKSRYITRIIVDTDCEEIMQAAHEAGAETLYTRPPQLAGDFSDLSDVRLLATSWLELMEGYWFDYLAIITPPHPLWPVTELDKAYEQFVASDYTSLVSVTPTEMNWDAFYRLNKGNANRVAKRKAGQLYARSGAFSIFSRKPNGHYISTTYRKAYPVEFKTMLYPLNKKHAYDINTPHELSLCRKIHQNKVDTVVTIERCEAHLAQRNLCLPSCENGPVILLHYPDNKDEFAINNVPVFTNLLKTLADNDIAGRYIVCGTSLIAGLVANSFGLPQIERKTILKRNGALTRHAMQDIKDNVSNPTGIVYLNGYGGCLKPESITRIMEAIDKDTKAFCTTLRKADHPPQWILEMNGEDVFGIMDNYQGFRQKIEDTYVESQLLAGFGTQADEGAHFTTHIQIDAHEATPLTSIVNIIEAYSATKTADF
ncbi:MAG: hypothetical protein JEY79_12105 [Pseudodesulfovibrio sp.]|nr:hypothetical protein [Pseudodesulfovibrio sp.]